MVSLPRAKTANELNERGSMWMCNTAVDIDTNFIDTVYKLQVESIQKLIFGDSILQKRQHKSMNKKIKENASCALPAAGEISMQGCPHPGCIVEQIQ
jgi:hypothetical protein